MPPIGNTLSSLLNAFSCINLNFFSIPLKPIPEILEITPGKYSETTVLLKPTVSKLHPPL